MKKKTLKEILNLEQNPGLTPIIVHFQCYLFWEQIVIKVKHKCFYIAFNLNNIMTDREKSFSKI